MKRPKIEDYNVYHSSIYANYVEALEKHCDWLEKQKPIDLLCNFFIDNNLEYHLEASGEIPLAVIEYDKLQAKEQQITELKELLQDIYDDDDFVTTIDILVRMKLAVDNINKN